MEISQDRLKSLLEYDEISGVFKWRVRTNRTNPGDVAGCFDRSTGYLRIQLDGKLYRAHRLAWLYTYGEKPKNIDHADMNKTNNRISNLRVCNASCNAANTKARSHNSSGYKGVTFNKWRGKWQASIQSKGKSTHLGYFDEASDAAKAYASAAHGKFGEFARM